MSSKGASLTIAEAEDLLRNKWDITLYDKTRLEPGVAAVLAKHPGPLDLYSLKELSTDDARSLAEHRGRLHFRDLSSICDEALAALAKHEGPLIMRAPKELSEAQAEALGRHRGPLLLQGVEHLTASVASHLAQHQGPLFLNDVRTLSSPSAEALSKHKGPLYLLQVCQVSDEVAEMLARHQGAVAIFPLTEMSERARTLLKEHRRRSCDEQGLPNSAQFKALAGTFHPSSAGEYNEWAFVYYPRLSRPDPVLMRVYWRSDWVKASDRRPPAEIPDWFISLLPRIGECIERIYTEPPFRDSPAAYLLNVLVEIVDGRIHAMNINMVDAEGVYWEACIDTDSFPEEYSVLCWGGNHYESAAYLAHLPLNHSIFDSTLEGLKWWQGSPLD
jgi:hypothetical protein